MQTFTAFGLIFESPFDCPEFLPVDGKPDVIIRFDSVPKTLDTVLQTGIMYEANATEFLLTLDGIASYWVQNGRTITIQVCEQASLDEVRLFLFNTCLGVLLHQRGMLALHAAALYTPRGGLVIAGKSAVGKSVLLAEFLNRGYRMLGDDLTAITVDAENKPIIYPAFPQIKLWQDALKPLGLQPDELPRVRPQLAKYSWLVPAHFFQQTVPVFAVIILNIHNFDHIIFQQQADFEKFKQLFAITYQQRFLDGFQIRAQHFSLITRVSQVARVFSMQRPFWPFNASKLADKIEQELLA